MEPVEKAEAQHWVAMTLVEEAYSLARSSNSSFSRPPRVFIYTLRGVLSHLASLALEKAYCYPRELISLEWDFSYPSRKLGLVKKKKKC